jgi:hypothetical protein
MDYTVINLEENIGKTVGRHAVVRDAFKYGMALQKSGSRLTRALGYPRFPKGVFRFRTFEEADAWMMKQMIRTAPKAS